MDTRQDETEQKRRKRRKRKKVSHTEDKRDEVRQDQIVTSPARGHALEGQKRP